MEKINAVMAALELDAQAAQSVIALFTQEGFETIEAGLVWAQDVLSSLHEENENLSAFDNSLLFSDNEEGPSFHVIFNDDGFAE